LSIVKIQNFTDKKGEIIYEEGREGYLLLNFDRDREKKLI